MFDAPADVPPLLVALSLASAALLGVSVAASPTPAPSAGALADTVDAVAAADEPATETHEIRADAVRISRNRIAVRGDGGTAHATLAYGPVVPVREDTALARVLRGEPPSAVFGNRLAFANAAVAASARDPVWRTGADRLTVRRVTWGGVDVTLVGA
ncbi:DUF7283 family protein [Halobacterium litoreum]|uniref:Uncharacterized protein n=1 Tax=Halobacterium litoreum TaxID=2039234 RepID=A0ABD5NGL1_9EURY|nr:hypothetical protein [Halobacterium litoreum]UHH12772.1 hypothetical protein LT972_11450 [Halobacterium litoreum]